MLEINKIHLGDSYELIKEIPDNSVDLVIIDPPYEIVGGGSGGCFGTQHRDYHGEYKKLGRDEHKREGLRISANFNKLKENLNVICAGFDYSLLDELDRLMTRINIYIWCNKNQVSSLMKHYEDLGCNVDLLVWLKTNPIPTANNKYLSDLEYCVFARENNTPLNGTYETKSKAWVSPANIDDKALYDHPTIKPLERIKHFIINSSQPDDIVLDCFSGSGTTCVAAKELGRRFIGIEIDANYHKISVDRLNGITTNGQTSIFTDFEVLSHD
jgi:DNA modification methylase